MWAARKRSRPRRPPRRAGKGDEALLARIRTVPGCEALTWDDVQIASTIFAVKPGDGSAREQAASCQRVLGAGANIAVEYATKRYRSNLINWGMLPFQIAGPTPFGLGDYILIPNARKALAGDLSEIAAYVLGAQPAYWRGSSGTGCLCVFKNPSGPKSRMPPDRTLASSTSTSTKRKRPVRGHSAFGPDGFLKTQRRRRLRHGWRPAQSFHLFGWVGAHPPPGGDGGPGRAGHHGHLGP